MSATTPDTRAKRIRGDGTVAIIPAFTVVIALIGTMFWLATTGETDVHNYENMLMAVTCLPIALTVSLATAHRVVRIRHPHRYIIAGSMTALAAASLLIVVGDSNRWWTS